MPSFAISPHITCVSVGILRSVASFACLSALPFPCQPALALIRAYGFDAVLVAYKRQDNASYLRKWDVICHAQKDSAISGALNLPTNIKHGGLYTSFHMRRFLSMLQVTSSS